MVIIMEVLLSSGETPDVFLQLFFVIVLHFLVWHKMANICCAGAFLPSKFLNNFFLMFQVLAIIFFFVQINFTLTLRWWTGDEVSRHCNRFTKESLSLDVECDSSLRSEKWAQLLSMSCCQCCSNGTQEMVPLVSTDPSCWSYNTEIVLKIPSTDASLWGFMSYTKTYLKLCMQLFLLHLGNYFAKSKSIKLMIKAIEGFWKYLLHFSILPFSSFQASG